MKYRQFTRKNHQIDVYIYQCDFAKYEYLMCKKMNTCTISLKMKE